MLNSSTPASIQELLDAAEAIPSGNVRLALYEEAVRWADTHRDVDAGFRVRRLLIDEAASCLRYDLYAATFSWCFSMARANPDRFQTDGLLEHYQHVVSKVVNFPDVTRAQYESLFEDGVRELSASGLSLRVAYLERRSVAIDFGDPAMAVAADLEWRKHPRARESWRGNFFIGEAHEKTRQLEYDSLLRDDRAVLAAVDSHFASADRDSALDRVFTVYSLLPLLRMGRRAEAAEKYRLVEKKTYSTAGYFWERSEILEYLVRIGDWPAAIREFKSQLPVALAQRDPLSHFYCLRPSAVLFDRLVEAGIATVAMAAPTGVSWAEDSSVYSTTVVRDWLRAEVSVIAARFDQRNGNTYYSEWLEGTYV